MAITRIGNTIYGLAADTKPTAGNTQAGREFIETDTRKKYLNTGTEWILQELNAYRTFRVTRIGSTYYFLDQNGKLERSGSDFDDEMQAILDAMPINYTYDFIFDAGTYVQNEPILIPSSTSSAINTKSVRIRGVFHWGRTGGSINTVLRPSTAFPNQRYAIEANNTPGSLTVPILHIDGLCFTNNDNFGVKDIGFIKVQSDESSTEKSVSISNTYTQYAWRGYHLLGGVWWGRFVNINTEDSNTAFVGDTDLLLEGGGALGGGNPSPKYCYFENLYFNHQGQMNQFIKMTGGSYNHFNAATMDATKATVGGIVLDNNTDAVLTVANNVFINPNILDVGGVPVPDNRQAGIYLNGQYVYNNWFYACMVNKIINHYKVSNGAQRNYIESTGLWGSAIVTSSTGAGISNILEVKCGALVGGVDTAVTDTGSLFVIKDQRRGAENSGFTSVADGGTITHGLMTTPLWIIVVPSLASTIVGVTAKSTTTFTVSLKTDAGAAGTTQSVYWRAGVYA